KGYELTMTEGTRTREMGYLAFEKLDQYRAAVVGDTEECISVLKEMKARFGLTEFCLWYNIGGIAPEHVERSMRLTAEKVFTHV
ncbi:MAG: hypothetical protein ACK5JT_01620, partial [Hyphomicrobiaceae bacterium]